MKEIQRVAVVGAGTMGQGIAQVCASGGLETLLFDVREEQTDSALKAIDRNLNELVEKGKLTESMRSSTRSNIHAVSAVKSLAADLIIEAAVEELGIKQQLFLELEDVNTPDAILATNTSSLSITSIASRLQYPERFVGIHFFNPADRMKLVEIISGPRTSSSVMEAVRQFLRRVQKTAVLAKDSPGFIVNRVARHYYGESLRILEEQGAGANTIDALMRSAGFKMGPFELMDLIGLDTNLAVTKSVYAGFNRHARFQPSPIQEKLVREGNVGRKSGRGFYNYRAKDA